jgi:hypothetical protein
MAASGWTGFSSMATNGGILKVLASLSGGRARSESAFPLVRTIQPPAARRLQKEAELNAKNNGIAVLPENGNHGHRSLVAAVEGFLGDPQVNDEAEDIHRVLPEIIPPRHRTQRSPQISRHFSAMTRTQLPVVVQRSSQT